MAAAFLAAVDRRDYGFIASAVTRATLETARTSDLVRLMVTLGAVPEEGLGGPVRTKRFWKGLSPTVILGGSSPRWAPASNSRKNREILGVALQGDTRAYVTYRVTISAQGRRAGDRVWSDGAAARRRRVEAVAAWALIREGSDKPKMPSPSLVQRLKERKLVQRVA